MNEHHNIKTPTRLQGQKEPFSKMSSIFQIAHTVNGTIRLFMELDHFYKTLVIHEQDLVSLRDRLTSLETNIPTLPEHHSESQPSKKKYRRLASDIERNHTCPYPACQKAYGSEISLNLHIRIKHNGGSKIDRENLAKDIMTAQLRGEQPPKSKIQLPPGFLQQFCNTYEDFIKKELIINKDAKVKVEEQ